MDSLPVETWSKIVGYLEEAHSIRDGYIDDGYLQATCKEAHSIRDGFIDERKSAVKAHKVTMRKLKKHIAGYIYEARNCSDWRAQSEFVNPFTGEFDYTDYRGAWYDDDRENPLTVEVIEERDRMVRDNPVPLSILVHHGLQHYSPPLMPPHDDTESDEEDIESDEEEPESGVEHSDYEM